MFKLNLKIALRNLLKNKAYTFINIFGLSAGLASFIVILLYLNFETSFDKWDNQLKRVYRAGVHLAIGDEEAKWPWQSGIFSKTIAERSSEVESIARINGGSGVLIYDQDFFYDVSVRGTDSTLLQTIPFTLTQGDAKTALAKPNSIILSKSLAERVFKSENPVGKVVKINPNDSYIVTGVWDDKQNPSHIVADAFYRWKFPDDQNWGNYNWATYIKLKEGVDAAKAIENIGRLYLDGRARSSRSAGTAKIPQNGLLSVEEAKAILKENNGSAYDEAVLEPVTNINMSSYFDGNTKEKTLYVLSALAIFLLAIACINFTNLAIAQAGSRAKEIGVKKVMGSYKSALIRQFFMETLLQCGMAFFLSLILVELLLPSFNQLLGLELSLYQYRALGFLLLQVAGVLAVVIVLAGAYPAVYLSGFNPAMVLKGNYNRSAKGIWLRKALIIVQFFIAGTFLICFLVISAQLTYMRNKDLGFNGENVMIINIQNLATMQMATDRFEPIRQRLKRIDGVMEVTRSSNYPWNTSGSSGNADLEQEKSVMVDDRFIDYDYFKLLDIKLVSGRFFEPAHFKADTVNAAIINETAAKAAGWKDPVGQKINRWGVEWKIVGVVRDFNAPGFETQPKAALYRINDNANFSRRYVLIKIAPENFASTRQKVIDEWTKIETGFPVRDRLLTDTFAKVMQKYDRLHRIMQAFSFVTFFISLMGIFALAAFTVKMRTKEIAVRKLLGSSTGSILSLLNRDFMFLVIGANGVAVIASYVILRKWLSTFIYQIEMPWMLYVLTIIVAAVTTLLTVSFQAWKSANTHPATALKYE
ncbi:MAG TPA: ABC transporter permease [Sphingobacteriaceae bacterium]